MQAAQNRQAKMLEGILKQRDMYKKMYQQCIDKTSMTDTETEQTSNKNRNKKEDTGTNSLIDITKSNDTIELSYGKSQDFDRQSNQIKNDFETYKKEKAAHEKMLNNEMERLRKEAENSSARCCRLKAQLDSANERFSLIQSNVVTYKSQIKVLEEKCNSCNLTIGE